jgi:hypothetical protein
MDKKIIVNDLKRKFWQFPWKYKESILISAGFFVTGFIIEFATGGKGISMPAWPVNFFILLLFITYVIVFNILIKHPIKKWLSSTPAAISSISVFAFLILLMGFIPQGKESTSAFITRTGLSHIVQSWPYLLCSFNLLFILSFTIVRRIQPFSVKNVAFTLNHLGLWIVIVAASLGSADSVKLNMMLTEEKITLVAYDEYEQNYDLNFGLKLLKFNIDEYPPDLGFMDTRNGELLYSKENLIEAKAGNKGVIGNWTIEVKEFIENAFKDSVGYLKTDLDGGAPAALINAHDKMSNETRSGWVTSGNPFVYPKFLNLTDNVAVAMTIRKPKKFTSEVRAYSTMKESEDFTVEVNKPVKYKGWTIYQSGYDEPMGKWSTRSVLQLVRDPWLPAVYTGIFMILAGALYLLWIGRTKNQQ